MKMNSFGMPRIFWEGDGDKGGGITDPPPGGAITDPIKNENTGTFRDALPDDLRNLKSIQDIKTLPDLVKSFDHTMSMVGKTRLPIPDDNSSETDWNDYYKSIGRPDNIDGYKLWDGDEPKLPEGLKREEAREKGFKEISHKLGLNNTQARKLYEWDVENKVSDGKVSLETNSEQLKTWDKEIKDHYGKAYDERLDMARQAIQKIGTPEMVKMLDDTGFTNHPEMIKFCAEVGKMVVEHHGSSPGSPATYVLTPDQAKQRISEKQADPGFMKNYQTNDNQVLHEAAVKEMSELFKQAHPALQD